MLRLNTLDQPSATHSSPLDHSVSSFSTDMPISIRRQRRQEKNRNSRDEECKKACLAVAKEIRSGKTTSIRQLSKLTGVPKSTVSDIKQRIARKDERGLRSLVSPKKRAGAQRILSSEEEAMVVTHLQWSARRGFAVDNAELKSIMGQIANDGRARKFKNGVPSHEAMRSFRARHPELRFRKTENKEAVKLKGEDYLHVKTYEDALRQVKLEFPKIYDDPDYIWNMDETSVDAEFGERKRVYSNADTHHGGYSTVTAGTGDGRHVTSVIACSPSGKKAPPFFIIQGKRNMSNWYLGLDKGTYNFQDASYNVMLRNGWFPNDACVVMTEKGSMDMATIPIFMKHLDKFVRQHIPHEKPYLLVLDGHSSRKGVDWLEVARARNCEVVQSPANTSHFLQPCDQHVNKRFAKTVRKSRDAFCLASAGKTDTRTIQAKLMFAALAMEAITAADIRKSWEETGLWPMDFRFVGKCKVRKDEIRETQEGICARMTSAGPATALGSVQQRLSDKETLKLLATIVEEAQKEGGIGESLAIQKAAICLDTHQSVNNILMSKTRALSAATKTRTSGNIEHAAQKPKNIALPSGAPAEYLTHGDVLQKRRDKEAEIATVQAAKAEKKRQQADKRREKEMAKTERSRKRAEAAVRQGTDCQQNGKKRRTQKGHVASKSGESREPEAIDALMSLGTQE